MQECDAMQCGGERSWLCMTREEGGKGKVVEGDASDNVVWCGNQLDGVAVGAGEAERDEGRDDVCIWVVRDWVCDCDFPIEYDVLGGD